MMRTNKDKAIKGRWPAQIVVSEADRHRAAAVIKQIEMTIDQQDVAIYFDISKQYVAFAKGNYKRNRPKSPHLCPAYVIRKILAKAYGTMNGVA